MEEFSVPLPEEFGAADVMVECVAGALKCSEVRGFYRKDLAVHVCPCPPAPQPPLCCMCFTPLLIYPTSLPPLTPPCVPSPRPITPTPCVWQCWRATGR